MLKMTRTKRRLSAMLAAMMLLSIVTMVSANNAEVDPSKAAVYLNGMFDGKSAIVRGDIYSANGDVSFNNAEDNVVSGSIYLNATKRLVLPAWYFPDFSSRVVSLDQTAFEAPAMTFLQAPEIETVVASFDTGDDADAEMVTQNTHYNKLNIDTTLKVDVSQGDLYLVADKITFSANGRIELVGDGNLFLFISSDLQMSGQQTIQGNLSTGARAHVFVEKDVNISNDTWGTEMHASIYANGNNITVNTTKLYGNVVSNTAKNFRMTGSQSTIYGTVYTPAADASVRGSGVINGRLVANTLSLFGRGEINYDGTYATLTMPGKPVAKKYTVTVAASPATGGVVTQSKTEVNSGETVTISATANEGYEFVGFTATKGTSLPDENGMLVVTEDVALTANFAPVPVEPELPGDKPMLIHFPYAYLYGNEDGTVGAENNIKREEAAALIYRLLKQDGQLGGFTRGSVKPYENIESGRWSRSALEYMKYIGVYTTDYISPETYIARGEVAKIIYFALGIRPDNSKMMDYADLSPSHPSYQYIKALVDIGVLQGYGDTIQPDKPMTRAEFVTMVNRLIGRDGQHEVIDEMNPYPDLVGYEWYYADVMRASFGYFDFKENGLYRVDPEGKPDRYSIDYN